MSLVPNFSSSPRAIATQRYKAAWVLILAFHLVLPFVLETWHQNIPDEDAYQQLAANIARHSSYHADIGHMFQRPGVPQTHFAPGWPALLALGYFLFGETGFWVVLGVVWCASAILAMVLADVLDMPRGACWGLVGWLTLNPFFLYYHGHLMTEPLSICLAIAGAIVGIRLIRNPSLTNTLLLAFISAIGQLTRSQLLIIPLAAWLITLASIPRAAVMRFPVFALVSTAILAPWLWRMHQVGAGFTATERKLGVNLITHNNPAVEDSYDPQLFGSSRFPVGRTSVPVF